MLGGLRALWGLLWLKLCAYRETDWTSTIQVHHDRVLKQSGTSISRAAALRLEDRSLLGSLVEYGTWYLGDPKGDHSFDNLPHEGEGTYSLPSPRMFSKSPPTPVRTKGYTLSDTGIPIKFRFTPCESFQSSAHASGKKQIKPQISGPLF